VADSRDPNNCNGGDVADLVCGRKKLKHQPEQKSIQRQQLGRRRWGMFQHRHRNMMFPPPI